MDIFIKTFFSFNDIIEISLIIIEKVDFINKNNLIIFKVIYL